MPGMIIRRIAPDEAALWRMLRLEALALAPEAFVPGQDDRAGWRLRDFAAEVAARSVFLALAAGEPVGCIGWTRDADPGHAARQGWIDGLYVTLRARGQGLGARLIAVALADAAAAGLGAIRLEVGAANARARATYARVGFVPVVAGLCGDSATMILHRALGWPGVVMRLQRRMSIFARRNGKVLRAIHRAGASELRQ